MKESCGSNRSGVQFAISLGTSAFPIDTYCGFTNLSRLILSAELWPQ